MGGFNLTDFSSQSQIQWQLQFTANFLPKNVFIEQNDSN